MTGFFIVQSSEKGSFLSCFTAAFVFCLVERYNHAAAFAQDAALFFKTDDGDKEKRYLIERQRVWGASCPQFLQIACPHAPSRLNKVLVP